ncbi:RYamide receptor-like [Porites lutea]|uniref:RYamide receptor-like n=1 Tax=Porites lutea TaxID=51062 RepID=UPI003CC5F47F
MSMDPTESVFPNITNNATKPGSGDSYFIPPNIQIGVTIFAVLIFILALIGNIVVIYIVCTVNHMRSSTNTLIANMAVADLLMTIDIPYILKFFHVGYKWFGTFMGTVLCKFFSSAQVGSLIASVFSLVAISLDRSFAILFPMKTVMTRNVVRFAIAMVWLGALAFSLPVMVASKTAQLEGTDFLSCAEFWAPMSANTFSLVLIIGGYIIPLIIIAFVYSLAGIRLWSRQLPGHRNLVSNKKAQSSSRRATAMLITVVIVFALSWMPFQTLEMLRGFNKPLFYSLPIELRFTTPWFGYANSAINPILYVIFSENYRQEFYRILCRGPTRKDRYRRTIISRSTTTRSTRLSRASSLAVSIPLQKLREEANYRRQGPESP